MLIRIVGVKKKNREYKKIAATNIKKELQIIEMLLRSKEMRRYRKKDNRINKMITIFIS